MATGDWEGTDTVALQSEKWKQWVESVAPVTTNPSSITPSLVSATRCSNKPHAHSHTNKSLFNSYICMRVPLILSLCHFSADSKSCRRTDLTLSLSLFFCIPLSRPSWDNEGIEANLFPQPANNRQPALFLPERAPQHICIRDRTNVCPFHYPPPPPSSSSSSSSSPQVFVYPCAKKPKMCASVRGQRHASAMWVTDSGECGEWVGGGGGTLSSE